MVGIALEKTGRRREKLAYIPVTLNDVQGAGESLVVEDVSVPNELESGNQLIKCRGGLGSLVHFTQPRRSCPVWSAAARMRALGSRYNRGSRLSYLTLGGLVGRRPASTSSAIRRTRSATAAFDARGQVLSAECPLTSRRLQAAYAHSLCGSIASRCPCPMSGTPPSGTTAAGQERSGR